MDPSYCPLAWNSIAMRNNGEYRLCCYANVTYGRGTLREKDGSSITVQDAPWDEIRNHELIKEVRSSFLKGEWHPSCGRCQAEEASGMPSGRKHALKRYHSEEFAARVQKETSMDGAIVPDRFPLEDIDLRFGNKCNLSCRSCGPTDSSGWYSDWIKHERQDFFSDNGTQVKLIVDENGRARTAEPRFDWYEKTSLMDRLPQDLSQLKRIYIVGGEPLLIAEHQRFLEELVELALAPRISLEYNSNLTVLPKAVLDLWSHFKKVGVGVSMDGVGRFHEYLRYPGKFDVLDKNLSRLDDAPPTVHAWIAYTVSIANAAHIPDFMLWKWNRGPCRINQSTVRPFASFHPLHQPKRMSLKEAPPRAKEWIEAKMLDGLSRLRNESTMTPHALAEAEKTIMSVISFMKSSAPTKRWFLHWERLVHLDDIRSQTFKDIEPELCEILESAAADRS